jgi:hypothetical protein
MFKATDRPWAPFNVVRSDDKRRARLNIISDFPSKIPYLPKRGKAHGYVEPDYPYNFVPDLDWRERQVAAGFRTARP